MIKLASILIFFLLSCSNGKKDDTSISSKDNKKSTVGPLYLYIRLSGKAYPYKPGKYKRNKTAVFFVDKENGVYQSELVSSILNENNILSVDSGELKTATLIYRNTLPIDRLIYQKGKKDENGFQICFIDIDSMCIRKIISIDSIRQLPQYEEVIAKKIIENF